MNHQTEGHDPPISEMWYIWREQTTQSKRTSCTQDQTESHRWNTTHTQIIYLSTCWDLLSFVATDPTLCLYTCLHMCLLRVYLESAGCCMLQHSSCRRWSLYSSKPSGGAAMAPAFHSSECNDQWFNMIQCKDPKFLQSKASYAKGHFMSLLWLHSPSRSTLLYFGNWSLKS